MNMFIDKLTAERADNILSWKYEKPYDFYNNKRSEEGMRELIGGSYYAIVDESRQLIGYFCTGASAQVPIGHQYGVYEEGLVDMGLGMNPCLTGKGKGYAFCSFILRFLEEKHEDVPIRLTVATFNKRAIHLYAKLGFIREDEFSSDRADFMTMVKR